jgi:hypothetical protein
MLNQPKLSHFGFTPQFSMGKFWFLFIYSTALLVFDCVTTVIILEACGGVELNPLVNAAGLFNITVYKIVANVFVGFVSFKKKFLWLLAGLSVVFSCVVAWNAVNIFLAL